jgi:ABC-type multidrug transport system ATPase subunit
MDPKTRRFLWNCLNNIRNYGKSLILTTHSMEETEALCTRMGIMVNGELKCLGNLQHLKTKYGEGYTLLAKISDLSNVDLFIKFIQLEFQQSVLKENRDGFVNMQIRDTSTSMLASIFSIIEKIKEQYSLEYYFVTQTKLEQIFLNFASRQIDPESRILIRTKCCC